MARNVEIKARIASVEALLPRAAAMADEGPIEIVQDDTFFRCESGRLKLRDFLDGSGELIFYRRADQSGPKESFYLRSATPTPAVLRDSLSLAYGQAGRVVKHRTLFLVGRTRVHLDRVEGLGHFLELEVVLGENENSEVGVREAHELMSRLGIEPQQLVEGAYVELFGEEGNQPLHRADVPKPASQPSACRSGRTLDNRSHAMAPHATSIEDRDFRAAFEASRVSPAEFNHEAHLRLAYVYVVEHGPEVAKQRMRQALLDFLSAHQIPAAKFHETITSAWVQAVSHFMDRSTSSSFAEFVASSQPLLDSKVMLTHYSARTLFSAEARASYVEPDLEPIPRSSGEPPKGVV